MISTAVYAYSYTIRSGQVVKSPKFGLFPGLIAPKPYVPHQNSCTKGTSLGCRLSPKMIPIAHNCAVWAAALSQTPYLENRILGCFEDLENPVQKFGNFSPVYACGKQFTSVVSKMVEICARSVAERQHCIDHKKTKHSLAPWGKTPGAISPIFLLWVCTMACHLYSRFHPHRFQFGEMITEKRPWALPV